jgi:hypothetical protein
MQKRHLRFLHVSYAEVGLKSETFSLPVNLLDMAEFAGKHRAYADRAIAGGLPIYDAMMNPAAFVLCAAITEVEQPAIKAIATRLGAVADQRGKPLSDGERQYCGMVVRELMEANGYVKTDKVGSVGVAGFSRGAIYMRVDGTKSPFEG